MTFEERIDRLTERQEALAQSLELLTATVREMGVRMDQLTGDVQKLTGDVEKHDQLMGQILEATARNNKTVANLALIAQGTPEASRRHRPGLD